MLPYFADPSSLPAPLPTEDEIESATPLPSAYPSDLRRSVIVRGQYIVRHGSSIKENEGHALLLLEKYASVPSPKLYAMYRRDNNLYIVVEFKSGIQLAKAWRSIPEPAKSDVVAQLRIIMGNVRDIPSKGIYGSVSHGKLSHSFFWSPVPCQQANGPFEHEKDFNVAMNSRSRCAWEETGSTNKHWMSGWLARNLPTALRGHPPVFTHGDFQQKNILVEKVAAGDIEKGSQWKVTAVVDWEDAGWYPSYREYASCFLEFGKEQDNWPERLEGILHPFPVEASLLRILHQDLDD